jgi:hypothetical protein
MPRNAFRRENRFNEASGIDIGLPEELKQAPPPATLPELGMITDESDSEKGFFGGIIRSAISGGAKPDTKEPGAVQTSAAAQQLGAPTTAAPTVGNAASTSPQKGGGGTRVPDATQNDPNVNLVDDESVDTRVSPVGVALKKYASYLLGGALEGLGAGVTAGVGGATAGASTATAALEGISQAGTTGALTEGLASAVSPLQTAARNGLSGASTGAQFTDQGIPAIRGPSLPAPPPTFGEQALQTAKDYPGNVLSNVGEQLGITDSVIEKFNKGDTAGAFKEGGTNLVRNQLESRLGSNSSGAGVPAPRLTNSFPRVQAHRQSEEEEGEPRRRFTKGSGRRFSR